VRLFFRLDSDALKMTGDKPVIGYEHDDYVWVAPQDARELLLFPGIANVLNKVF